jgi:hypothetical protein
MIDNLQSVRSQQNNLPHVNVFCGWWACIPTSHYIQDPDYLMISWQHRKSARAWARRVQLPSNRLEELDQLVSLGEATYISKSRVKNLRPMDTGNFGQIYQAVLDASPVAVKEFSTQNGWPNVFADPWRRHPQPSYLHGLCAMLFLVCFDYCFGRSPVLLTKMREILLELTILVRLRHPNIVTFWGTSTEVRLCVYVACVHVCTHGTTTKKDGARQPNKSVAPARRSAVLLNHQPTIPNLVSQT